MEVFLEKLVLELSLKDKPGVFRWRKRKGTFQAEGTESVKALSLWVPGSYLLPRWLGVI